MPKQAHFDAKLFSFLRDLEKHNDRAWFEKNKPRYEAHVKAPLLAFIGDFAGPLKKISPHFVADPRPNGGSMFRIYRDTRFSKDKRPYKTHASAQFRHARGKDVHAPGFYLHLEPGSIFMGCGIWHPEAKTAAAIRQAIVDDPTGWKKATQSAGFAKLYRLSGDSLKRPPRGFDPEHAFVEDLQRKDFIAVHNFSAKDPLAADFQARFIAACKSASPFMKFLARALELPY